MIRSAAAGSRGGASEGAPVPSADHSARLGAVREGLTEARLDALLLVHPPNLRYLTGFTGSNGVLVVFREEGCLLTTDFRYEEQADQQVPPQVTVRVARDGLLPEVAAGLSARPTPLRVGFEGQRLTVRDRRELGELCGGVLWEEAPPLVERLRERKDMAELAHLERAAGIAEATFERLRSVVREGMTEGETAAELDYALRTAGSGPTPFPCIVASGPRSSLPHAEPSERRLREGDLVLFDFGATAAGYCSDITRTVVLGEAEPWQRDLHDAVMEAQRAAVAMLRADVPAREVDGAARRALEGRGLGDRFGHSTGHGLGLEVHEGPRLSRRSEDVLRAGHVVTVEPGVYLRGRGGIRLEDDFVVAAGEPRPLTRVPAELVEL